MTLSWNEIKDRALIFSKEWAEASNEDQDAKSFLDAFFNVFGIPRRKIGTFEYRVKKLSEADGYIDLLWKQTILIEMKSRGKNLDKAFEQAKEYTFGLKNNELPKYILVSDFENFRLYDLEENKTIFFKLNDFVNNVQRFGYLLGYQKKVYKEQDPANIKAAELMGKLHDRLEEIGFSGHPLEVYLVRILFCLFAEDTTIFNKQQFQDYIEQRTNVDGSDLAARLHELFQVLNTPIGSRFKNLDEQLSDFPYVNGKLFEEILPMASFDSKMRQALLNCCYIDWSKISPAIFGSMFQSVMNPKERRNLGAHYTSETNILKLIKPLFLDDLWNEFDRVKNNRTKLSEFHKKLSTLKFLDPACGCGNFLVITYRELRLLEFEILKELNKAGQRFLDVSQILWIDVDQFSGIEYEEFPARIAEVAMWLIDHQMNMMVSNEFGQYIVRLPLNKSAKIVHGDALEFDWHSMLNQPFYDVISKKANLYIAEEPQQIYDTINVRTESLEIHQIEKEKKPIKLFDYIIGNPPFIGSKIMSQTQRNQITKQFENVTGSGILDYVTGWYIKAAKYIQGTQTKVAFVSTNSIVQGEQTSILWGQMLAKYKINIHFAHRTFKWRNEAKGNAAVYCVIIGFANFDSSNKRIFEYEDINGEAHEVKVNNINPYLVDAKDILILSRTKAICLVPEIGIGNKPIDGGYYLFDDKEKENFILVEPKSEPLFFKWLGGDEFLNNKTRWCLFLKNVDPNELRKMPEVLKRIEKVRQFRLNSTSQATIKLANFPTKFHVENIPSEDYLVLPEIALNKRRYFTVGYESKNTLSSNLVKIMPFGTKYHFGLLSSTMFISWLRNVGGQLGNQLRFSKDIVYNNFPWPENPSEKQLKAVETAAQKVLDVRKQFPSSSLADLYDPLTMPPELTKAHNELDKVVDSTYRSSAFTTESSRMKFLFELHEKYTAGLFSEVKTKKAK
jgi:hypothetical protein